MIDKGCFARFVMEFFPLPNTGEWGTFTNGKFKTCFWADGREQRAPPMPAASQLPLAQKNLHINVAYFDPLQVK